MQSKYLLILAFLAMNGIKIVTRVSRGIIMVNFVRNLVSMFVKKLDISWQFFVLELVMLIFIDGYVPAKYIRKG